MRGVRVRMCTLLLPAVHLLTHAVALRSLASSLCRTAKLFPVGTTPQESFRVALAVISTLQGKGSAADSACLAEYAASGRKWLSLQQSFELKDIQADNAYRSKLHSAIATAQ